MNGGAWFAVLVGVVVVGVVVWSLVRRSRVARPPRPAGERLRFTPHASDRMSQRHVSQADVGQAVARPDRVVATRYLDRADHGDRVWSWEHGMRDSVRLEKDFAGRTLKVWVPTDWKTASVIAIKSVAWQYNARVKVPVSRIGSVIGRGGETIRGIERDYGVRVTVDRRTGSTTIAGDDEKKVAAARRTIGKLAG